MSFVRKSSSATKYRNYGDKTSASRQRAKAIRRKHVEKEHAASMAEYSKNLKGESDRLLLHTMSLML